MKIGGRTTQTALVHPVNEATTTITGGNGAQQNYRQLQRLLTGLIAPAYSAWIDLIRLIIAFN